MKRVSVFRCSCGDGERKMEEELFLGLRKTKGVSKWRSAINLMWK